MFELGDRVIDINNDEEGIIVTIETTGDMLIGVLWETGRDKGQIFYVSSNSIEIVQKKDVVEFLKKF